MSMLESRECSGVVSNTLASIEAREGGGGLESTLLSTIGFAVALSVDVTEDEEVPGSLCSDKPASRSSFFPTALNSESTSVLMSAADLATSSVMCSVDLEGT